MLIIKTNHGYRANRKYVQGRGFVDSLTSSLKSIGSYVSQNKDLIAKPLLGAVGNLAATGLEEGTKALVRHVINKKNNQNKSNQNTIITTGEPRSPPQMDAKALSILENLMNGSDIPVANIIGSGIKKF